MSQYQRIRHYQSSLDEKNEVIDTEFIKMTEESLAGIEAIENMSDNQVEQGLSQIKGFAEGFSNENLCADGIAGIFILLYRLKVLDKETGKASSYRNDRNSFLIYQNISKKIEDCLQGINELKEMYEINDYIDILGDMEKIEKAFEKTCQFLLKTYKQYKDDEEKCGTNLYKVSQSVDAALTGILEVINSAKLNVDKQKEYIIQEYKPFSEKIFESFGRLLSGLWTYKYGLYFTGVAIYNIYNVVILPGNIGPTLNTFFRILTAMCIAFASDPVYLNKARKALVDLFGNTFLKICQMFIPFINIFPEMSAVKGFISFLIHIFFIGYTNIIRNLSIMVCKCIGTTYALYEVGGLSGVFWESVYDLSYTFIGYGVNMLEFIQGIFEMFSMNIMEMVSISIKNISSLKDSIFSHFSNIMEPITSSIRSFLFFDTPVMPNATEIIEVREFSDLLKTDTNYPLIYTNAAGNLVKYDEEFKTKVVYLMKSVYNTFQNKSLTPNLMGREIVRISQMPSYMNITDQEKAVAMQAIRFALIDFGKNIVYQTLTEKVESTYEKVENIVEEALESTKMKPIITWGSSIGPLQQSYISAFLYLTIFSAVFSLIFGSDSITVNMFVAFMQLLLIYSK